MNQQWMPLYGQALTQNDSFVTKANGTAALMTSIFTWVVPRNTIVTLNPTDVISAYLKDAGAECLGTDAWQLVKRNASTGDFSVIIGSGIYTAIKEFQDQNKVKRVGGLYRLTADFVLDFQVKATTVLVNTSCYISIGCTKYVRVA